MSHSYLQLSSTCSTIFNSCAILRTTCIFHLALSFCGEAAQWFKECFQPISIRYWIHWLGTGWVTRRGLRSKDSAVFQADSKTLAVEIPEIQFPCEETEFLKEKVLTWGKERKCSGRSEHCSSGWVTTRVKLERIMELKNICHFINDRHMESQGLVTPWTGTTLDQWQRNPTSVGRNSVSF